MLFKKLVEKTYSPVGLPLIFFVLFILTSLTLLLRTLFLAE